MVKLLFFLRARGGVLFQRAGLRGICRECEEGHRSNCHYIVEHLPNVTCNLHPTDLDKLQFQKLKPRQHTFLTGRHLTWGPERSFTTATHRRQSQLQRTAAGTSHKRDYAAEAGIYVPS